MRNAVGQNVERGALSDWMLLSWEEQVSGALGSPRRLSPANNTIWKCWRDDPID